jgi:hypothetical protein
MLNPRVLEHLVDPLDRATGHARRPEASAISGVDARGGKVGFVSPWRGQVPEDCLEMEFGFETAN